MLELPALERNALIKRLALRADESADLKACARKFKQVGASAVVDQHACLHSCLSALAGKLVGCVLGCTHAWKPQVDKAARVSRVV